ncbi:CHAT domain-containing protein [Phormidium tenue FACHB-886]|nr:CHAT domain-containing protein [Phormidium tenue FACHB-886]
MPISILLNLGSGDLQSGFPRVTATLWSTEHPLPEQWIGGLPPAPHLASLYREWKVIYQSLCNRKSFRALILDHELEIDAEGITNVSQKSFQETCQQLQAEINRWLNTETFRLVRQSLQSRLDSKTEIRVVIETNDPVLRRIPWQQWNFFKHYEQAELALSQPEYQRRGAARAKHLTQKVRILAVLGHCAGIDVEAETQFLKSLQDADVTFLVNPSERSFHTQLEQRSGWDILFFAGHSQTEGETGRIYLSDDTTNTSLTLDQLKEALQTAINNGLKLAIFNSCDGLGLALELERVHIPVVIVMREAVPNRVAQQFFNRFLEAFAIEKRSLYLAVRQARHQLQSLEDEFPGASWLPVICQNPAAESPTWFQLGGMPSCPYRGLFAFQEEDADLFFGREQFTQQLTQAVQSKALVAVIGASGSGKSSLVLAGLVPELHQHSLAQHQIITFRPGNNPFQALAEELSPLLKSSFSPNSILQLEDELRNTVNGITQIVNHITTSISTEGNQKLILIADQFEELYTQTPEVDCQLFLDQLLEAIRCCRALTIVLTLRADFYGYALSYRPFSDALQGSVYNLGPMNREELQSAIECPASRMQVQLEPSLTAKLIEATWASPGRLPLLEFALTQLWSKQYNAWLTHEAYDEIGGVEGALANHAEDVYKQLNDYDRDRVQRIFLQLVQPGVGTDASRRLATRDEVGVNNWDLVSHLASTRLIVTNRNEVTGEETVEVVHEALIKSWQRLAHWISLDQDFRHWQEDLRVARRRWEDSARDEEALLAGKLLIGAEQWYRDRHKDLSSKEQQFIQLSLLRHEQILKQRSRRRKRIFSSLIAGFFLALLLAGFAILNWQKSAISEVKSITASSEALFAAPQKRLDALIAAIQANQKLKRLIGADLDTKDQALKVLQQANYQVVEKNRLLLEQGSFIWAVALSPDYQSIAAASEDKTVRLWSPNGQEIKTLTGHAARVWGVAFSLDNQIIASASEDKTVRLWSREGQLLHILRGHRDAVWSVAISPDSQTLASSSSDGTVRLWSREGRSLQILKGHNSPVFGIAFSPDGQLIGSTSQDGTVKLWDRTGKELNSFKGHSNRVAAIAFSPNSQQIATASDDGTAILWNRDGKKLRTFVGHSDAVWHVAFSPNGQLATASWDGTIKLWRPNGDLITTLNGHTARVRGVVFSPNGQLLVSGSEDSTVRLWRLDNTLLKILPGHTKAVIGTTFSPNGQWVASVSDDSTMKLWNRNGDLVRTVPLPHVTSALGVTFSRDSRTMVAASDDGRISFWNLDGIELRTFKGHDKSVWHVAFSPDNQTIASTSSDQTIKLWTLEGKLLHTLKGHQGEVREVRFSPNGQFLASASLDGTVKLWKSDGTQVRTFPGHEGGVLGLAFSPDGQKIASGGFDHSVKLWTLNGTLLKTLDGHDSEVRGVAFSPNNQMIASTSADSTVKLWDHNGNLLNTLRGHNRAVWKVAFSADSQTIASSGEDKILILWDVNRVRSLDPLVFGCDWVRDYLHTNAILSQRDRSLCNGVSTR